MDTMDSSYEKRILGSPYTSPVKAAINSPLSSPSKEIYSDRLIPIRANSRWEQQDLSVQSGSKFVSPTKSKLSSTTRSLAIPINMPSSLSNNSTSLSPGSSFVNGPPPGAAFSFHYYNGDVSSVDVNGDALRNSSVPAVSSASGSTGSSMSANNLTNPLSQSSNLQENTNTDFYASLLTNELYTSSINDYIDCSYQRGPSALLERENMNLFSFKLRKEDPEKLKQSPYSLSPLSDRSHRLLKQPRRLVRKIPKTPYKVLDAPELQDDFYLNLVDWSSANILAVGLGSCVYLWNAVTSQVTRLCDLTNDNDAITSVSWAEKASLLAVGTQRGAVQIWDVNETRRLRQMDGHSARVGALAWNGDLIVSGSRDRTLRLRDIREGPSSTVAATPASNNLHPFGSGFRLSGTSAGLFHGNPNALTSANGSSPSTVISHNSASTTNNNNNNLVITEHRQEVCGLKWSPNRQLLASGGNDNRLLVWSLAMGFQRPMLTFEQHIAAVKAIDWSPHQHGLLASGGGTADKCIRFWNTLTGQPLQCIDTGSQVCNIAWSKHSNELVSTHGYSQHQIILWTYPSLRQSAKLMGHTYRVLYLATSPCGENIVTGAGDETLRFWNVFAKAKAVKPVHSAMGLFDSGIR